jgi:hypothetical protein
MNDPLLRATSSPPATLGEGCISRYDPNALSSDNGTEFTGAAELWQQLQAAQVQAAAGAPISAALLPAFNPALEPKR